MQRRLEPADSLDYFPTQPWAVRALCEFLSRELGEDLSRRSCWEPACGEGHMVLPLREYFASVRASDCIRYPTFDHEVLDFLEYAVWAKRDAVDWVITNPPFVGAERFIRRAQRLARRGVVMFVRGAFTESGERYEQLFHPSIAPSYVVTYSERVVLLRNRLIRSGALDPFNFNPETFEPVRASSATAYSLVIWLPGQHDTRHRWIPPCRVDLERDEDFPAYAEQWAWLREKAAEASGQGVLL
jgi:hypothetical protein